jgi:hypothetical protein
MNNQSPDRQALGEARREFWTASAVMQNSLNTERRIEAGGRVQALIERAKDQQSGWGGFGLEALRALGKFLRKTPRLRGRPKKESNSDSLPSLADLGITDRHMAADALKVAAVTEDDFKRYLDRRHDPSLSGLLRFSEIEKAKRNPDPIAKRVEEAIIGKAKASQEATRRRHAATAAAAIEAAKKVRAKVEAIPAEVKRKDAVKGSLAMLLHERTPTVREAAAAAVLRIVPDFLEHYSAILDGEMPEWSPIPEPLKSNERTEFRPLSSYQRELAEKDILIADYRKTIAQLKRGVGDTALRRELSAVRAELAAERQKNAKLWEENWKLHEENTRLRMASASGVGPEKTAREARVN